MFFGFAETCELRRVCPNFGQNTMLLHLACIPRAFARSTCIVRTRLLRNHLQTSRPEKKLYNKNSPPCQSFALPQLHRAIIQLHRAIIFKCRLRLLL
jgi:hypothetical protein